MQNMAQIQTTPHSANLARDDFARAGRRVRYDHDRQVITWPRRLCSGFWEAPEVDPEALTAVPDFGKVRFFIDK
jgi:hypothetical protein